MPVTAYKYQKLYKSRSQSRSLGKLTSFDIKRFKLIPRIFYYTFTIPNISFKIISTGISFSFFLLYTRTVQPQLTIRAVGINSDKLHTGFTCITRNIRVKIISYILYHIPSIIHSEYT